MIAALLLWLRDSLLAGAKQRSVAASRRRWQRIQQRPRPLKRRGITKRPPETCGVNGNAHAA